MKHSLYAAAVALMAAPAAQAIDTQTAMQSYLDAHVMEWSGDATILAAVTAQNARTAELTAAEIDQLDKAWRAEVGTPDTPMITPVLENPAADVLREKIAASGGTITEIFVMDAQGLNVAASSVTSDYSQASGDLWQGRRSRAFQRHRIRRIEPNVPGPDLHQPERSGLRRGDRRDDHRRRRRQPDVIR